MLPSTLTTITIQAELTVYLTVHLIHCVLPPMQARSPLQHSSSLRVELTAIHISNRCSLHTACGCSGIGPLLFPHDLCSSSYTTFPILTTSIQHLPATMLYSFLPCYVQHLQSSMAFYLLPSPSFASHYSFCTLSFYLQYISSRPSHRMRCFPLQWQPPCFV